MLQSKLFPSTQKQPPKEAVSISHKLLTQAGFIDQLASGIWSFLPLGWRAHQKIAEIIRQEINKIGGQEVFLPTLSPKELWLETGRWDAIDPPLFKVEDRHKKELALGSTHEEVITYLARKFIKSYKELPLALYQIQTKFRNEMRATSGLLRTREFAMKDLYSFHADQKDLDRYYKEVQIAYKNIFKLCGLESIMVEASSGTIGGKESHEFMVLSETGEDKIIICQKCGFGANLEVGDKYKNCPNCKGKLIKKSSIESGHIFKLGVTYSQKMKANFVTQDGKQKPLIMGCYGIGLGRLMATIVEALHDSEGIVWNKNVSPFDVHLILISKSQEKDDKIKEKADKIYQTLQKEKIEVLYDERKISPGIKLKDSDLIGIPVRLIVSEKTGDKVEFKERDKKEVKLLSLEEVIKKI
ncbi:MAG: prolyl-tRNA synthetase [Parcubacteria group bacterium Athens1014_10]|nr:MAG: prolyl-tRNA synthetase [Parcubacteria group bacterium Athens1014_10]TSD04710.1 MAG: prolyl-tRNA synthetase [Parcubacteria group bacterium Athens0714_12]